jgi:LPS sulfotransferase NodH
MRTGSTLVSHDLARLASGEIPGEIFQENAYPTDPEAIASYLLDQLNRYSDELFVFKMTWHHAWELRRRLAAPDRDPRDLDLTELLPRTVYVNLSRRDKASQAVSLWQAVHSRVWHVAPDESVPSGRPTPRPIQAASMLFNLLGEEVMWEEQYEDWRIEPLQVIYEDYLSDRLAELRRLAAHVGLPVPERIGWADDLTRMADESSSGAAQALWDYVSDYWSALLPASIHNPPGGITPPGGGRVRSAGTR